MRRETSGLLILIALLCLPSSRATAQSGATQQSRQSENSSNTSPQSLAASLYEESEGYSRKKLAEYSNSRQGLTPALYKKVDEESRALALKNASIISARENPTGEDLFYLGLLYGIAGSYDDAVTTLRKSLSPEKGLSEEKRAGAEYYLAVTLINQRKMEEAESAVADFGRDQPGSYMAAVSLNRALEKHFRNAKNLEKASGYGRNAFEASKKAIARTRNTETYEAYLAAGSALADLYASMKQMDQAAGVLEELRSTGAANPGSGVYSPATTLLVDLLVDAGMKSRAQKMLKDSIDYVSSKFTSDVGREVVLKQLRRKEKFLRLQGETAPELQISEWIDQPATSLKDLRGHVVLIDFWATWCGPCLASFPILARWHQTYSQKGLVVLGITMYYGSRDPGQTSRAQEMRELKQFKIQHNLPYGIGVAGTDANMRLYGVEAIPTAVLIDKTGTVRWMGTGVSSNNEHMMEAAIQRALDEPSEQTSR